MFVLFLDLQELSPPTVNLKKLYEQETLPEEPILIVISPGADPSQELQDLASEAIGHDRYHQVLIEDLFMFKIKLVWLSQKVWKDSQGYQKKSIAVKML